MSYEGVEGRTHVLVAQGKKHELDECAWKGIVVVVGSLPQQADG